MATTPTQLPVPSEKPQDLKFNSGKIDEFVTSMAHQYIDRLGGNHYTIEGLRQIAQQAISSFGYITVDSFQDGATLTLPNQVLRDKSTGDYYRWDGVLPKVISSGSTPGTSGGVGKGAWFLISTKGYDVVTTSMIAAGTFGVDTAVNVADRDNALFKVVSGGTPNGMDILDAGNERTAVLILERSTTIKSIGAKQNDINVDETVYVQRWIEIFPGTIEFGACTFGYLNFKGKWTRRVTLTGNVKAAPTSSNILWEFSSADQPTQLVLIDLNGFTVDCNFQNQPVRNDWIVTNNTSVIKVYDGEVVNVFNRGIGGTDSFYSLLKVRRVNFTEGSLHNGGTGDTAESCHFIGVYGGYKTDIRYCKFKQQTDAVGMQNRNPGGIFISGSNGDKDLIVTDCEFDNLGNLINSNLVSPLDLYSHARSVTYARNKFTRSRFVAFRATNAEQASIIDNEVVQDVPIKYDGGAVYNDATCLSIGIVDRGYDVNKSDNYNYEVRGNVFKVLAGAGNCRAITAASDSTTHLVHHIKLDSNTFSGVASNGMEAILLDNVMNADVNDSLLTGFAMHYRVQRTSVCGALAVSKGMSGKSVFNISTKKMTNSPIGVYAREQVSNLNITLSGADTFGITVNPYSIRDAEVARVTDCIMGSTSNGEAQNNKAFYYQNNSVTFSSDPTSYTTKTYYRLQNNIGRTDRSST